mmetsp:Transcript_20903/g.18253  ORF Transcript_20903/g.18253 Transcript_20903/m.18253 type:complete len:109 (+) Transcript_20903:145-471(+)
MARRFLWKTIVNNLEQRDSSIVFTTHSMSEAESLCHKIGILINGKFVVMGTLPYLKNRYGSGYKISIVKQDSNIEEYDRRINEEFKGCTKVDDNSELYDSYKLASNEF